ncbi:MAG: ribulose-phosphate 3-epimerase [Anaerolineae bacterium]|nr:ribulose-phosphate 3-epimerase [Anaerolineae bacterium]
MTVHIAPSILAADFTKLGEEVRAVSENGADSIHIDVMDGHFVPNLTFGAPIVSAVRRATTLPLDVHLMIEQPERYLEQFVQAGADMLTVHVETCPHLHRTLQAIHDLGVRAGVALNPHTPFELIREILPDVERVLVMTVNPGFGGQRLIPRTLNKVAQIRTAIAALGQPIELGVDGGVDCSTIGELAHSGADVFVAGSAIFGAAEGVAAAIAALRAAAARDRHTV